MSKNLHIGFDRVLKDKDGEPLPVKIPLKSLKRHFAALGSSGSGKTVLVKAIMEECIRAGIPLIIVDLQGDLASLALTGNIDTMKDNWGRKGKEDMRTVDEYHKDINAKKQVAIWTPASDKGLTLSINPLKAPPDNMEHADKIQAVDSIADTIANILGYKTEKGKGAEIKAYLYLLLEAIWDEGEEVESFNKLANYIYNDQDLLDDASRAMIKESYKEQLAKEVKTLTIGADSLIFNAGVPLDIEAMMTWADKGRVPVNVLFLNTLRKQSDKVNFIADTATQVYNYMLKNPSDDIQLVFVLDELAGLVPPTRAPPSKRPIQLLLKQARKYGVSLLLATQNISDVDYKSLGQVGTWALGRLMARQDIEKVKDIIQSISPAETDDILSSISKQKTGQFMLLAPDVFSSVKRMNVRWLATDHTTLDEKRVKKITNESGIRDKFPDAVIVKNKKKVDEIVEETTVDDVEIIDEEEEDFLLKTEMAATFIPQVSTQNDIVKALDAEPIALSAEELSEVTGDSTKKLTTSLNGLVTKKKLNTDDIEGTKIYWSVKHKMDPENNIIGPLFQIQIDYPESKAVKIMEGNIKKDLFIKREKIHSKTVKYIPLWRIGTVDIIEVGTFRKKRVEVKKYYYVNGLTGGILNIDKKEDSFGFPFKHVDPDNLITLNHKEVKINQITLQSLMGSHLKPILNRMHALGVVERKLGVGINTKIIPALIWYPVFRFTLKDKDTNKRRYGYVDGVFGLYASNDPLTDEDD